METLQKFDAVIIVNVAKAMKDSAQEQSLTRGSTLSALIREQLSDIAQGKAKTILRIRLSHSLPPGEYAFVAVPKNGEESNGEDQE